MAIFFGHASSSRLSSLSSLISIFRSSSQLVTSSTPRLHGSIEAINASTLSVSNYIDFGNLGAKNYVVTFGLFCFLGKKRASTFTTGAVASTSSTQGLNFGKHVNKKTKKTTKKGVFKKIMGCPISLG